MWKNFHFPARDRSWEGKYLGSQSGSLEPYSGGPPAPGQLMQSGNPFDKGPYTADHGPVPMFDVEGHINHLDGDRNSKRGV